MYDVAVIRGFEAQHYLIGGDWGAENELHTHHYRAELQVSGPRLDQHGYLGDLVDVEQNLDALVAAYRDKTLNDMPAFAGLNPSIEHFSRILAEALAERIHATNVASLTVRLWETEAAWASYSLDLP